MESFWEFLYDTIILLLKVLGLLVTVEIVLFFGQTEFHIPVLEGWVQFVFAVLGIQP